MRLCTGDSGSRALRRFLTILLSRAEDDVPLRACHHGGNRASHDLAVALDLDLSDRDAHRQIVDVVSLPPDDECASGKELARLGLLRDLLRQNPVSASARESRRPRLAVCERELASFP